MKEFFMKSKKGLLVLCCLLVFTFVCMIFADQIQKSWGKVEVKTETMEIECDPYPGLEGEAESVLVKMCYKIYKPKSATKDNKAPAVLLLHGYQNDKETCDAYSIELSKRGYVVLAIDEFGHGKTSLGFKGRGFVNHKVTVNYGNEDEMGSKTFKKTGGPERYRIMMNFSNLSFFFDKYSKDEDGNILRDSSMGGIAAYAWLSDLEYVDETKMAISGHSMGTWAGWTVAAAYGLDPLIYPKALILQCGELFRMGLTSAPYDQTKVHFGNVMLLQAKWDEFSYFRDYEKVVSDDLLTSDLRQEFLGTYITHETPEWNKVFGNFNLGTAREIVLLYTNHRLTTHNKKGLTYALNFLARSFGEADYDIYTVGKTTFSFGIKEILVLLATLSALASVVACIMIIKNVPFFAPVFEGLNHERDESIKKGWKWWKAAILTMLIAGIFYPFATQLGHGLFPLPEAIFRMSIGNGFFVWYLLLILTMLGFMIIPRLINKKKGLPNPDFYDYGLARLEHKDKFDWVLLGKAALVALIGCMWMYLQVVIIELLFQLDFRYIWPFFKGFTGARFLQFLVYIPIFIVFYVLNNSKIFPAMRVEATLEPGFKNFMNCWWRYALLMSGGIILIILIEYIPFFMNIGPGADLLFGSTFGGPFMSLLIVFFPQVIIFSLICTYLYRKTGSVYVGAITVAILACWIVTGGSAMM